MIGFVEYNPVDGALAPVGVWLLDEKKKTVAYKFKAEFALMASDKLSDYDCHRDFPAFIESMRRKMI